MKNYAGKRKGRKINCIARCRYYQDGKKIRLTTGLLQKLTIHGLQLSDF